jgi:uncharacterized protein YbjT (DUF2867 family)
MKINVIITGATGMVGKGVLLECLDHPGVQSVLSVSRRPLEMSHDKLKELIVEDFFSLQGYAQKLNGYNACFFCLGTSAFGMREEEYRKITYDLTVQFALTLLEMNDDMTFCYVSGAGTDSAEKSRQMWARVKGRTENALLRMPFRAAYMFRPGVIQPLKGVRSATKLYNAMYTVLNPVVSILRRLSPGLATTSVEVGQAMIHAVLYGYDKKHLENLDIHLLASR